MAVHCRPWTSAVLALQLEVGLLAVISTAWLSLADPLAPVADFAASDRSTSKLDPHVAEKVSDSGRSRTASALQERISAERLHPKTVSSRGRPITGTHYPEFNDARGYLAASRSAGRRSVEASAASRCMNSIGDLSKYVGASCQGVQRLSPAHPKALHFIGSSQRVWRVTAPWLLTRGCWCDTSRPSIANGTKWPGSGRADRRPIAALAPLLISPQEARGRHFNERVLPIHAHRTGAAE